MGVGVVRIIFKALWKKVCPFSPGSFSQAPPDLTVARKNVTYLRWIQEGFRGGSL